MIHALPAATSYNIRLSSDASTLVEAFDTVSAVVNESVLLLSADEGDDFNLDPVPVGERKRVMLDLAAVEVAYPEAVVPDRTAYVAMKVSSTEMLQCFQSNIFISRA